ncbi:MAG: 16S rRNA (adenine(1518)-N(6)/adenine(1519)-N(6))-dimethyltransferase RsmA [Legionellales bacterium]|nr:16S rRNA (adenine(1518)-N(6)/adenine(1519)-N(6))-dimethyltransferase RsmA [Legionellales bacterium]
MHHKARKRFGQHFLTDPMIIDRIVSAMHLAASDTVIEIGPGLGALTLPLLQQLNQLTVIEIDRDLIARLRSFAPTDRLTLVQADVLKVDVANLITQYPCKIVGNLPYNISTPLLFHLLQTASHIDGMWFMLQHEVAQRLAASPNQAAYGRLSIMAQYHCQIHYLFHVPPQAFHPPPKVDSAVVWLQPHTKLPHIANDYAHLNQLVTAAFSQRRKTIRNALKNYVPEHTFSQLAIDPTVRPAELSLAQYVKLSNHLGCPL